jgi:hypothetical protein
VFTAQRLVGHALQRRMEHHEEPSVAAVLQDSSILEGGATSNGYKPPASTAAQESGVTQDLVRNDDIAHKRELGIMEAPSLSHIDRDISEPENISLQNDFSALKASLSAYLELQIRSFRKAGGDEACCSDAESDSSEDTSSLGLLLSDAVKYIQYLEGVQQQLINERASLEDQVNGYEKEKSEDGETV